MCILLYVKCIWYNGLACSYGHLGGPSAFSLYVHCPIYETYFGVMVLHAAMVVWGSICLWYIFVLYFLCVKLMWCNGFAEIYARSAMKYAKCGVAVLKASMLDWEGVNLPWVYVYCAIYETYLV